MWEATNAGATFVCCLWRMGCKVIIMSGFFFAAGALWRASSQELECSLLSVAILNFDGKWWFLIRRFCFGPDAMYFAKNIQILLCCWEERLLVLRHTLPKSVFLESVFPGFIGNVDNLASSSRFFLIFLFLSIGPYTFNASLKNWNDHMVITVIG